MIWSDFFPFVLPNVLGCPQPLAESHILQAAIEFCRRTQCDVRTLDPVTSYGSSDPIELDIPSQTQPLKLISVAVNGVDCQIVDAYHGRELMTNGSVQMFCFTDNKQTITFNPVLPSGAMVTAVVSLAPSRTAKSINDDVASPYVMEIASGALATLHMIPLQPWSDSNQAASHRVMFSSRIATIAAHFARGQSQTKARNFKSYF